MSEELSVNIVKLDPNAKIPTYGTAGAGAFDFYSIQDTIIYWGQPQIIGTGLAMEIPTGYSMLIFSRSGQGFNQDVRLSNCVGVIDSDYRGEIKIKLTRDANNGALIQTIPQSVTYRAGDRIAQGLLVKTPKVTFTQTEKFLTMTERGAGGLGSTGK